MAFRKIFASLQKKEEGGPPDLRTDIKMTTASQTLLPAQKPLLIARNLSFSGKISFSNEESISNQFEAVNLSGRQFLVSRRAFLKISDVVKANAVRCFNKSLGMDEYFLTRDANCFLAVLDFIENGELHMPKAVCPFSFKRELEFWKIKKENMETCCRRQLYCTENEEKSFREFDANERNARLEVRSILTDHKFEITRWHIIRKRVWKVINNSPSSTLGKVYLAIQIIAISMFILSKAASTHKYFQEEIRFRELPEFMEKHVEMFTQFCDKGKHETNAATNLCYIFKNRKNKSLLADNVKNNQREKRASMQWQHISGNESKNKTKMRFNIDLKLITVKMDTNSTLRLLGSASKLVFISHTHNKSPERNILFYILEHTNIYHFFLIGNVNLLNVYVRSISDNKGLKQSDQIEGKILELFNFSQLNVEKNTMASESIRRKSFTEDTRNNLVNITGQLFVSQVVSKNLSEKINWQNQRRPTSKQYLSPSNARLKRKDHKRNVEIRKSPTTFRARHTNHKPPKPIKDTIIYFTMKWLNFFHIVLTIYFVIEYFFELVFSPAKMRYILSFHSLIDVISTGSSIVLSVDRLLKSSNEIVDSHFLNNGLDICLSLVSLKTLKLVYLMRENRIVRAIRFTLKESVTEIIHFFFIMNICVVVMAFSIYYFERDTMMSIPHAMWWAIVTITTLGYGDVVPQSAVGRTLGYLSAIFGLVVISLVVPIFVVDFQNFYKYSKYSPNVNKKAKRSHIRKRKSIVDLSLLSKSVK